MAELKSLTSPTTQSNETYFLDYPHKIHAFLKHILDVCSYQFGDVGQYAKTETSPPQPPLDTAPTANDFYVNPITGLTDTTRFQYDRDANNPQSLTRDANNKLTHDKDRWRDDKKAHDKKVSLLVGEDSTFLKYMFSLMSSNIKAILDTHEDMPSWRNLPPNSYHRSLELIKILRKQFIKGNSTHTVLALTKFTDLQQGNEATNLFCQHLLDTATTIRPLVEDKNNPGFIHFDTFVSLVLIKSLNKISNSANIRCLEIFLEQHKQDALKQPLLLVQALNQAQDSDLSETYRPTSEQSGAFATSLPHPPNRPPPRPLSSPPLNGQQDPTRSDHCKKCFDRTKLANPSHPKYFYHKASQCRGGKPKPPAPATSTSSAVTASASFAPSSASLPETPEARYDALKAAADYLGFELFPPTANDA
jgi:hypothetical protein